MPLYTFKCTKCDNKMEKFLHKLTEDVEILCEKCSSVCERIFGKCNTETILNAHDTYREQILPDVKRIANNVHGGKDSDFFDIYGDN